MNIDNSGDYSMHYISMVTDANDSAHVWATYHYHTAFYPTNYFDGGQSVIVGPSTENVFRDRIEAAGERDVAPLTLKVSVEWLGDAVISVQVMLKQDIVCTDPDGDGYGDPGQPGSDCPDDNCPEIYNFGQEDIDGDGIGDLCDPDIDDDGLLNLNDNCWYVQNPLQENSDSDSVGDACDNCQFVDNGYQYDEDSDGIGDACDEDILYVQCCLDMPEAHFNVPFSYQFWAIGGEPPYEWSRGLGQFPYGLSMSGDGILSGIPSYVATSYFQVVVEDQSGEVDTAWIEIDVYDPTQPEYVCGDADASENVDIDDVVYLIAYIFSGGPAPDPYESGDTDCSGSVDIDDVVYIIAYIFSGGSAPCDTDGDEVPDC